MVQIYGIEAWGNIKNQGTKVNNKKKLQISCLPNINKAIRTFLESLALEHEKY